MKFVAAIAAFMAIGADARLSLKKSSYAPVTFQPTGAGACTTVQCAPMECQPPFKWVSAEDSGTCCPLCQSSVAVPEDRSWAEGLSGGVGPNANADLDACKGVMCPTLHCEETAQTFAEGRCCTTCA